MAKDLEVCKDFCSQALAAATPGAQDHRAAADVLLAAQRRRMPGGQPDPYAVLGLDLPTPPHGARTPSSPATAATAPAGLPAGEATAPLSCISFSY
jgi:hypothetical protein